MKSTIIDVENEFSHATFCFNIQPTHLGNFIKLFCQSYRGNIIIKWTNLETNFIFHLHVYSFNLHKGFIFKKIT